MIPMFKTIFDSLMKKPATVAYPHSQKVNDDLVRGKVEIDIAQCIFCGICKRACPTGAIEVSKPEKTWSISPFSCIVCGGCVEACPKKCLRMINTLSNAGFDKTREDVTDARISDNPGNN